MKHIMIILAALAGALPAYSSVQISGRVLNGSRDSVGVAGVTVMLQKMAAGDMQDIDKLVSMSSGSFQFTVPSPDSGINYFISSDHQGARYYSEAVAVETGSIRVPAQLVIFDSTHDNSAVQTMMHHVFVEDIGEGLAVREMRIMHNPLSRTILNAIHDEHETEAALRFLLPAAAQNVEAVGSHFDELAAHPPYLYYKGILEPGNRQIGYVYNLAWHANEAALDLHITQATRSLDFFIANPDLVVQAEGVTDAGPFTIRNSTFRRYSAQNPAAGQRVQMVFRRQGAAFVTEHPYYAMATTAILMLLAMVVAFSRKQTTPKNDPSAAKRKEGDKSTGAAQKKSGRKK